MNQRNFKIAQTYFVWGFVTLFISGFLSIIMLLSPSSGASEHTLIWHNLTFLLTIVSLMLLGVYASFRPAKHIVKRNDHDARLWALLDHRRNNELIVTILLDRLKRSAKKLIRRFEEEEAFRNSKPAGKKLNPNAWREQEEHIAFTVQAAKDDYHTLRAEIEEALRYLKGQKFTIPAEYTAVAELSIPSVNWFDD